MRRAIGRVLAAVMVFPMRCSSFSRDTFIARPDVTIGGGSENNWGLLQCKSGRVSPDLPGGGQRLFVCIVIRYAFCHEASFTELLFDGELIFFACDLAIDPDFPSRNETVRQVVPTQSEIGENITPHRCPIDDPDRDSIALAQTGTIDPTKPD